VGPGQRGAEEHALALGDQLVETASRGRVGDGGGALVESAGFELALDDAQVSSQLGIVPSHLVEEALGVVATD
jgi:hypothetical protein